MEGIVRQERSLLQPTTIQEAMQYAEMMSKSSLVPESFRGKPGDILIAVQLGAEVGLSPVQSLQSIAVINSRPAIWGDGLMGLVLASGLMENYKEMTVEEIEKAQRAEFWCKRKGMPEPIVRSFSVDDAKRARLWSNEKKPIWTQYPWRMLQMRARSWALRDGFADVLKGLQCREEVEDYIEPRDITPAPTIQAPRRMSEKVVNPELEYHVTMGNPEEIGGTKDRETISGGEVDAPFPTESEPEKPHPVAQQEDGPKISERQRKRFFAIYKQAGRKDAEVKEWLLEHYGIQHSADILKKHYEEICTAMEVGGQVEPGSQG